MEKLEMIDASGASNDAVGLITVSKIRPRMDSKNWCCCGIENIHCCESELIIFEIL